MDTLYLRGDGSNCTHCTDTKNIYLKTIQSTK